MNKKAKSGMNGIIILGILLLAIIILSGGEGLSTIGNIASILAGIPAFVWVILILIFIVNMIKR